MTTQKPICLAGNWKMNHGISATTEFLMGYRNRAPKELSERTRRALEKGSLQQLLFLSPLAQSEGVTASAGLPIVIGAQNVHWSDQGAFTGEISAPMCLETGVRSALVAHSERRQYFGETDSTAKKRTLHLVGRGFNVILCVGETREEREAGRTEEVLTRQLEGVLGDPSLTQAMGHSLAQGRLVIAYEPVWAIGTGLTASPEQAQAAHSFIRQKLASLTRPEVAQQTTILYGGSVTPAALPQLLAQKDIDGGLVGGASLKLDSWLELLEIAGNSLSE